MTFKGIYRLPGPVKGSMIAFCRLSGLSTCLFLAMGKMTLFVGGKGSPSKTRASEANAEMLGNLSLSLSLLFFFFKRAALLFECDYPLPINSRFSHES